MEATWVDPRYAGLVASYDEIRKHRGEPEKGEPRCRHCRDLGALLFVFPAGVTTSDGTQGLGRPCLFCARQR
ncbi:hypothetical protein [Streptomyces atratus]|uniref:hypothetical protein n=1 Tax=Streptomyces atratus TaxID=1893 RepID=UPI00364835CB